MHRRDLSPAACPSPPHPARPEAAAFILLLEGIGGKIGRRQADDAAVQVRTAKSGRDRAAAAHGQTANEIILPPSGNAEIARADLRQFLCEIGEIIQAVRHVVVKGQAAVRHDDSAFTLVGIALDGGKTHPRRMILAPTVKQINVLPAVFRHFFRFLKDYIDCSGFSKDFGEKLKFK